MPAATILDLDEPNISIEVQFARYTRFDIRLRHKAFDETGHEATFTWMRFNESRLRRRAE